MDIPPLGSMWLPKPTPAPTRLLTITEFLLARIAEDEAEAHKWREREVRWPSARVLAECEAKRRIVEELRAFVPPVGGQGTAQARRVLGSLASVYADHPDYREEWRA